MKTMLLLLTILALTMSFVHGQLTIPKRELGYVYNNGDESATIKLAAYIDVTCPDSQEAYPTLLKVADHFGPKAVQLKFYLFSLPYHRNSHVISKGARVLNNFKSPKNATVFDWFTIIYANLESLTTVATAEKTDNQVLEYLTTLANNVSGIGSKDFVAGVTNSDIDTLTRLEWKYGCTRGAYGTPMFTINDVFFLEAQPQWPVEQWVKVIEALIK